MNTLKTRSNEAEWLGHRATGRGSVYTRSSPLAWRREGATDRAHHQCASSSGSGQCPHRQPESIDHRGETDEADYGWEGTTTKGIMERSGPRRGSLE